MESILTHIRPLYIALLSNITGKTQPINVLVDTNLRKRIAENRKKLAPIADTVKLCGRLGISFRGHCDDVRDITKLSGYPRSNVKTRLEQSNYYLASGRFPLHNAIYDNKLPFSRIVTQSTDVTSSYKGNNGKMPRTKVLKQNKNNTGNNLDNIL